VTFPNRPQYRKCVQPTPQFVRFVPAVPILTASEQQGTKFSSVKFLLGNICYCQIVFDKLGNSIARRSMTRRSTIYHWQDLSGVGFGIGKDGQMIQVKYGPSRIDGGKVNYLGISCQDRFPELISAILPTLLVLLRLLIDGILVPWSW